MSKKKDRLITRTYTKPPKQTGKTNWVKLGRELDAKPKPMQKEIEAVRKLWADADIIIPGGKTKMTVRFDTDMVEWFKMQGPGHQTRMNAVLRHYMRSKMK